MKPRDPLAPDEPTTAQWAHALRAMARRHRPDIVRIRIADRRRRRTTTRLIAVFTERFGELRTGATADHLKRHVLQH